MKDTRGRTLHNGDLVAYGARSGNTGELRIGILTDIEKGGIISGNYEQEYDTQKQAFTDSYEFKCSGVQGFGVDGKKLLYLDPIYHNDVYAILLEKASKYLETR